jgi:nucleoside-diphosphate-sugar epimerase
MFKKTRIAITGGSGFIGTNLVHFYEQQGSCEILNLDLAEPPYPEHAPYWKRVDITDRRHLENTLMEFAPDYLVHLAARTDLQGQTIDDYRPNIEGVANLLAACGKLPELKRVIFASSKLVCKNGYIPGHDFDFCPDTVYGRSKVAGEELILKNNSLSCSWIIVRPTSIWGPWFKEPYRNFFHTVQKGLYVHPKGMRSRKTYGYAGNTAYQLDRLLHADEQAVAGKVFYLGDYLPLEIYSWAALISREFGVRAPVEIPAFILKTLARFGDLLLQAGLKKVPYSTFRLENILTEAVYNLDSLQELCGDLPYTLEEGVTETVKWLKGAHARPAG